MAQKNCLIMIFFSCIIFTICSSNELESLPHSQFLNSLKNVQNMLQEVKYVLHEFDNHDLRPSNGISTCLKLMDMSLEELTWCVNAIESPDIEGNLSSDLRIWLSAIQTNSDECNEQLQETSQNIQENIIPKIHQIDTLLYDLYTQVEVQTISEDYNSFSQFPYWINPSDQQILQGNENLVFDVVVAADGTGNFTKVVDAVRAAPASNKKRYVIFIKKGLYIENVDVTQNNIMIVGEGMDSTFISGNLSKGLNNVSTYNTPTFAVEGRGFIAQDISFINTAGPLGYQTAALRSNSDMSVFYRCGFYGYQDTLCAFSNKQFYRECTIKGTIDFIFGSASAVFQKCTILVRKGLPGQSNPITAHGGKFNGLSTGFSFQFCNISADFDLLPSIKSISTFLGRPWKPYSTTIFMQSYIGDLLSPEGWLAWSGNENLDTLYYAEYNNSGPGASTQNRVKWERYHVINDPMEAFKFTVSQFIMGNVWLPSTGVPFTPGF